MEHLLVLSWYGACLCIAVLLTRRLRSAKYLAFFLCLFLLKVLVAQVVYDNISVSIAEIGPYSMYDSLGYYNDTLAMLNNNDAIIPELPQAAADPGYNTLLYWIGSLYEKAFHIVRPDYLSFLYSNAFLATLLFVAITHYLAKWRLLTSGTIAGAAMLLAVGEPTLLAFGAVLEREVLLGLLAMLTFVSFMEGRWLPFAIGSALLFIFRSAYGYLIPVIVLAWAAFVSVRWFRRHLTVYLCALVLLFGTAVQVVTAVSSETSDYFFRHIWNDTTNLTGLGGNIQVLPRGLSVVAYGILAFVSPVPGYPLFDSRIHGFFLFGLLVGLGSIPYLACNLIVLEALGGLRHVAYAAGRVAPSVRAAAESQFLMVARGFFAVFVSQMAFQGFAFNVRHKVQFVPFLILLSLYSLQFMKIRPGALGLPGARQAVWSVYVIVGLNLVYLAAKLFTRSGL